MIKPACNAFTLTRAGHELGGWLVRYAHRLTKDVGIGYEPSSEAPSTFKALKAEWSECMRTRRPMRVYDGACEGTVYGSAPANWAFRFWHDVLHVAHGLTFKPDDEVKLGLMQVKAVADAFGADSLEALVMLTDTTAQTEHYRLTGRFVDDQAAFVLDVAPRIHAGLTVRQAVEAHLAAQAQPLAA